GGGGPARRAARAARHPAPALAGPARPRDADPPAGASGLHAPAPGGGPGLPRAGPRPRLRPRGRWLGPLRGALAAARLVLRHRAGPGLPGDQVPPHQRGGAEPARPRDRDPRRDRRPPPGHAPPPPPPPGPPGHAHLPRPPPPGRPPR